MKTEIDSAFDRLAVPRVYHPPRDAFTVADVMRTRALAESHSRRKIRELIEAGIAERIKTPSYVKVAYYRLIPSKKT